LTRRTGQPCFSFHFSLLQIPSCKFSPANSLLQVPSCNQPRLLPRRLSVVFHVSLAPLVPGLVFRGSTGRRSVQGGRQATTRVSAVEAPCFTELTSPSAFCACSSFQPQFMSAICRGRFMLVQAPNKSTLFGSMQTDPASIRERLFTGIDGDYNVRLL